MPPDAIAQPDFARDALILDIDGTLIEIAPTPESVIVPPALHSIIAALAKRFDGAIAYCSGRTMAVVDHLMAPPRLAAIACHGAEIRSAPDAPVSVVGTPIAQAVKDAFADIETDMPGVRMEDKHYTLAFHYRLAPQYEAQLLQTIAARLPALDPDLVTLRGKAIVELKARGFNKGTGLRALMTHAPYAGRRPIFLGDDRTDEDVLAVLKDYGGTGYSVGALLKGASAEFAAPADVRAWLARMATGEG